jgi:putative oxidoreductase
MKIAVLIARVLLGLVFVVIGVNGFLNFIPGSLPSGLAGQFLTILMQAHYVPIISALQLGAGALLLVNRYVVLALVILGPIIVNIFLFHLLMDHSGIPVAVVLVVLWAVIALRHRQYLVGIFVQRAE